MTHVIEGSRPLRTALFVDFDNIYIGLKSIDPRAAEAFATGPARWLRWLEDGMPGQVSPADQNGHEREKRTVLIRRCYLNPRPFHNYRPYFIRSAFSVIDCPPLTEKGKNSADIQMVMDILDTLEHKTHFDEFIIMSGDADFNAVLLRLRAYDRRTAILTIGPAAEAYKAACDRIIGEETFIEDALGLSTDVQSMRRPKPSSQRVAQAPPTKLLEEIADKVYEQASANGEVAAPELPPMFQEFNEFRKSNWLGFFSLRNLTEELVRRRPQLRLVETDPWKLVVRLPTRPPHSQDDGPDAAPPDEAGDQLLREQIIDKVRELIARADEPVVMAKVAHKVIAELGQRVVNSGWAGAGTFKALLQSKELPDVAIITLATHPGYLYDPNRHTPPTDSLQEEKFRDLPDELTAFIRRLDQVISIPKLTPVEYAVAFEAIENVLREMAYNFTATSKAVRDQCIERGASISRTNISFVLRGITYAGHDFKDSTSNIALTFAMQFQQNVISLCETAQLHLSDRERELLDEWILGGLYEEFGES